ADSGSGPTDPSSTGRSALRSRLPRRRSRARRAALTSVTGAGPWGPVPVTLSGILDRRDGRAAAAPSGARSSPQPDSSPPAVAGPPVDVEALLARALFFARLRAVDGREGEPRGLPAPRVAGAAGGGGGRPRLPDDAVRAGVRARLRG